MSEVENRESTSGPSPVLEVDDISQKFSTGTAGFWAARDVSFTVRSGESVALVGESGSGKTTLARAICGLRAPTSGAIRIGGNDVTSRARSRKGRRDLACDVQMVFQDPYGSLDPTKTVIKLVEEPLLQSGHTRSERQERVEGSLDTVGLGASFYGRKARELSGGQRQRVGIARALVSRPRLVVLDEPVASLDVSIQGQVLQLLEKIRRSEHVGMLIIAHDLGVVRAIADRTLVMYRGSIVEAGETSTVLENPAHPYTQGLIWSATAQGQLQMPESARTALRVDAAALPLDDRGCPFRARCWRRTQTCDTGANIVDEPLRTFSCNHPMHRTSEGATHVGALA